MINKWKLYGYGIVYFFGIGGILVIVKEMFVSKSYIIEAVSIGMIIGILFTFTKFNTLGKT